MIGLIRFLLFTIDLKCAGLYFMSANTVSDTVSDFYFESVIDL